MEAGGTKVDTRARTRDLPNQSKKRGGGRV